MKSRSPDEKKLKSLEKKRAAALEMAQEKDETKKACPANEKEIESKPPHSRWGHGVVRDPRGLQLLLGVIANGFTDFTECLYCVKYDD